VYGGRLLLPKGATPELVAALRSFPRQALHAAQLDLDHPVSGKRISCTAELPNDMQELLKVIEVDFKSIVVRQTRRR
jgi:23S rRNA pseudouridine1911/1915/1917 synthase